MLNAADPQLTVDELAARAGLTVRTVRFYAGRGMLPPPRLRGRVGLYGQEHLARLDLIKELQNLGFTLAAVERYMARLGPDATVEDIALHGALVAPWAADDGEEMDRDALDRRAGRRLTETEVDRLIQLGALEPRAEDRFRVASAVEFTLAMEILDLPMPFELLTEAGQVINTHAHHIAADLRRLFADKVLRPYLEHGRPPEEREQLLTALRKLRPATTRAVVTAFQQAVDRAIREAVDRSGAPR
ncbi:DNA-binding transcriptional MerR regulator [Crossiella equi]|uniref:DNA-binding transcriptional MerR regulator n=1 Tax=Crossiella equi TaxID=130796 RepID=A0ABS5AIU1_9PSEU|nr:MerR family transcriptional regulator [Crossiella equi]MBP2476498.1 DNA-binding transcriptional MerR regulator [Crossiella equi]